MLNITTTTNSVKIIMPAVLTQIDQAEAQVLRHLADHEVGVDPFAVRILLREALANAVLHGSDCDETLNVEMELCCSPETVRLTVKDEGPGFDVDQIKDFDLMNESGRGLALMRIYADDVIFNETGNCVTMIKRIFVNKCMARGGN